MEDNMTTEFTLNGARVTVGDIGGAESFVAAKAIQNGRKCGTCSLCCKVLVIPEIAKPQNKWCSHCKPGHGCSLYEARPQVCKAFGCQWLLDNSFGPEWQPTRSKMVLRMVPDPEQVTGRGLILYVNVDHAYPNAWRQSPYYEELKDRSTRISVIVYSGSRQFVIFPSKDVEFGADEAVMTGPDGDHIVLPTAKAKKLQAEFPSMVAQARRKMGINLKKQLQSAGV